MNSEMLSEEPSSNQVKAGTYKWLVIALIVIGILGFIDASYLAAKHYAGVPIGCSLISGCETVTTSQYATVFNIPLALIGFVYYLVISTLLFVYLEARSSKVLRWLVVISAGGFATSLYLIYLQLFVIEAICVYCFGSAFMSTILFIGSLWLARLKAKQPKASELTS